jgi:hypothetical protein
MQIKVKYLTSVGGGLDNDTDDLLHDNEIRSASRTFRQTFDVPSSERLVNCEYQFTYIVL